LSIKPTDIKRGDIWRVNLDPAVGSEIKKSRPVVVISSNSVGKLPIKLIAPITGWDSRFENSIWFVKIQPDSKNNLTKISAVDALQLRCVDIQRFIRPKVGYLTQDTIEEITTAISAVIEYQ
jgi:mRNA interferase MazF